MSLPTSYLTSIKNLDGILNALRGAQAPEKFTQNFLESLDFKSSSDRLYIPVLKMLGFLDAEGRPQERYFKYLDQSQSETVMAEAIRDAYGDLFQVNTKANEMSRTELKNKFKTLSQGTLKEAVLEKMAMTFTGLVKHADFSSSTNSNSMASSSFQEGQSESLEDSSPDAGTEPTGGTAMFGGLHYNIQIILPATRDTKIYDAIFRSMKEHLRD